MTINNEKNGSILTIKITGRLDTISAAKLEENLNEVPEAVSKLVIDFEKLEYISSAGLRVLLAAQKKVNAKGCSLEVVNVSKDVMDIFEITGFDSIMKIKMK